MENPETLGTPVTRQRQKKNNKTQHRVLK